MICRLHLFRVPTKLLIGTVGWCCLLGILSIQGRAETGATPAPTSRGAASPFTNSISRSTFQEIDLFTQRDPFMPIGTFKPQPPKVGITNGPAEVKAPPVDIKLVISGISSIGDTRVATLEDHLILEEGGTFKYSDGKNAVEYKVLRITDGSVVILYEDKEIEFKMKGSDLNSFIEKEESK